VELTVSVPDFDDFDQALQLDVLAASLRSDSAQAKDMLEQLARMLQAAVPEAVTIERGGWFMSKDRPIQELNVTFDDFQFQIVRQKHGSMTASSKKLVRGVVLKTNEISVEKCIEEILAGLKEMSEKNAQTRRALNKFVLG
jgi:hypothetical protein